MTAPQPKLIRASVGLKQGKQCFNTLPDLHTVFDLLNGIPATNGGLMVGGLSQLKPNFIAGICPPMLHRGILSFQTYNKAELSVDGHVDPGGKTISKLNQQQPLAPIPAFPPVPLQPPSVPRGSESDQTVAHIRRALSAFASRAEFYRLWHAAFLLTDDRNAVGPDGKPCNCGNAPLAYAEHYLLARAVVASLGQMGPQARQGGFQIASSLVLLYDLLKIGNGLLAAIEREIKRIPGMGPYAAAYLDVMRICMVGFIFKQGVCPGVSYPKAASTAWGLRGSFDGLLPLQPGRLPVF